MLTDPSFTMPPVPDGGPVPGIRWLRRNVARFADGPVHRRRRLLVTEMLARVDVAALRTAAAERIENGRPVDQVPVEVLAAALGMPPVPADVVAVVAAAYQPFSGDEGPADQAVAQLVTMMGGEPDEVTAARIGVLVQACAATAGLISNAERRPDRSVAETLRHDPPVRTTSRRAPDGEVVTVDLDGHPFGAGPHECPGQAHAVAIAEGVLEARSPL